MFPFRKWFRKTNTHKPYVSPERRRGRLHLEQLEDRAVPTVSLFTNQLDYAPGSTALLTAGFDAGSTVQFSVVSETPGPGQGSWTVTDGGEGDIDTLANGSITAAWLVDPNGAYIGATLTATATVLETNESATAIFTDSAGSIDTTLVDESVQQNANHYDLRTDVYFKGANFDPGTYSVEVYQTQGNTLIGKSDPANPVIVGSNGLIANTQLWPHVLKVSDSTQGYDFSANNEYRVEVFLANGDGGRKSDNFKIKAPTPPLPVITTSVVTIEGLKYNDHNGNGIQDVGDLGIQGWHFTIWVDSNGNGIRDVAPEAFVDAGALNGVYDVGEQFTDSISNGVYDLTGEVHDVVTVAGGGFSYSEQVLDSVLAGTNGAAYDIQEVGQLNWVPTQGEDGYSEKFTTADTAVADATFGNTFVSAESGKTIGYWSNKNGQALITTADIDALKALNLRYANGSNADFDPTPLTACTPGELNAAKSALKSFLLGASATNMASMLSAQLAGTQLNALHGFFGDATQIYVGLQQADPGFGLIDWSGNSQGDNLDQNLNTVTTLVNDYGFANIQALIKAANTELELHSNTTSGTTYASSRVYQEALKIAFDGMNNNVAIFAQ